MSHQIHADIVVKRPINVSFGRTGSPGREVELSLNGAFIQWRYAGEPVWQDLIAVSELIGPQGAQGEPGDPATNLVVSVNDKQGVVVINKGDVGLANVNNTSDINKPISNAQQAALDEKATFVYVDEKVAAIVDSAPAALDTLNELAAALNDNPNFATNIANEIGTKVNAQQAAAAAPVQSVAGRTGAIVLSRVDVGLSNVDNTSDANKPVSVTQQEALDTKQPFNAKLSALSGLNSATGFITQNGIESFVKRSLMAGSSKITITNSDGVSGNPTIDLGVITKNDVNLGNVDNTADIDKPISTATQSVLDAKENTNKKNTANGYAGLDSNGLIPSLLLPSFVDDVLEFDNLAAFPASGSTGKIYTALDSNKIYRWSGSVYVEISASPGTTDAVPEGSINKYYTESRVSANSTVVSKANDNAVVHLTGNENIAGTKTFSQQIVASLGLLLSATSIATDAATGLRIGTSATQKLGFFNATPIVQVNNTTDLGTVLSNLGLRVAGSGYPISTAGNVATTGSQREGVQNITATSTLTLSSAKNQRIVATTAAIDVTLPATTTTGYRLRFKRVDATAQVVRIIGTIDGVANYTLSAQNKYVDLVSTSTSGAWEIWGNN